MKRLFQIFGGGIGWTLGGPIGALLGVAFGNAIHDVVRGQEEPAAASGSQRTAYSGANPGATRQGRTSSPSDFHIAMLILAARVIKADGRVQQSELDFVRQQFVQLFGKDKANESFAMFRKLVDQEIHLTKIAQQINGFTTHSTRLQLVHFLFKVAMADGQLHPNEVDEIHRIARHLRVSDLDYESIKAMFHKKDDDLWATKILEVDPNATQDEVKRAYRKMAKKYHPDRLTDAGPEAQSAAQESFIEVQKAYDHICQRKGWS